MPGSLSTPAAWVTVEDWGARVDEGERLVTASSVLQGRWAELAGLGVSSSSSSCS